MTNIQLHETDEQIEDRLRVTLTCISELRGAYPEIPLPDDVDRAALGDDAFFVTLPIGQAGARSRNQRTYSRAAVEQMVAQINQQRPEGMWGHLKAEETQTRYDPPAIRWLAALMDGDGIAWGKGLPLTEQTRDYYRLAKATNARVGTSLVAWAQMDGSEVTGMELLAVDLADPARVGVPVTAARPVISSEMKDDPTPDSSPTSGRGERKKESTQRRKEAKERKDRARHASPLQEVDPVLSNLTEMLGEGDVVERVRALLEGHSNLLEERGDWLVERAALMDTAITAAVERVVRIPAGVALVEELVRSRDPQTRDEILAAVEAVVESEAVQALLRAELQQAMGPSQRRPIRREGEEGYFSY